jgi:hypothetical protein
MKLEGENFMFCWVEATQLADLQEYLDPWLETLP